MKLHNRNKESSFAPLNDHHEKKRERGHRGNHVILKRDKRARIVDMLEDLRSQFQGWFPLCCEQIDAIIKEVEK